MGLLKEQIASLVAQHGARRVAEELVEVFHDNAGYSAKGARTNVQLSWLRLAIALGHVVHHRLTNWPS